MSRTSEKSAKIAFGVAAILAAATIGDGIFALPYVFYTAGWEVVICYLAILTFVVGAAHVVYLKTIEMGGEKERLVTLARRYFGAPGFWVGFVAIVIGLLMSLVAFLIIGTQFILLGLPGVPPQAAFVFFWLCLSIPIFMSDRRVAALEILGISAVTAIIIFIFVNAWPNITFGSVPAIRATGFDLFLPFSIVLFSLAGWTGVEPAYELRKRSGARRDPWQALILGTAGIALLYILFAAGIIGSATKIAPDTISGLAGWPAWKRELLALFGLMTIATVYLPISREIKNALEKDLRWNRWVARSFIIGLPVVLVGLGLRSFVTVISITGGLFLSTQYLLIVAIGRRALPLSRFKKTLLDLAVVLFAAAAVYEIAIFVVH